jgi:hypothetical protein
MPTASSTPVVEVNNLVKLVYSDNTGRSFANEWSFTITVDTVGQSNVAGQWDFDSGLGATVGNPLEYFDGPNGQTPLAEREVPLLGTWWPRIPVVACPHYFPSSSSPLPRYLFRGPEMGRLAPGSGMAVCPLSYGWPGGCCRRASGTA